MLEVGMGSLTGHVKSCEAKTLKTTTRKCMGNIMKSGFRSYCHDVMEGTLWLWIMRPTTGYSLRTVTK